jgi:hypothetical protein
VVWAGSGGTFDKSSENWYEKEEQKKFIVRCRCLLTKGVMGVGPESNEVLKEHKSNMHQDGEGGFDILMHYPLPLDATPIKLSVVCRPRISAGHNPRHHKGLDCFLFCCRLKFLRWFHLLSSHARHVRKMTRVYWMGSQAQGLTKEKMHQKRAVSNLWMNRASL